MATNITGEVINKIFSAVNSFFISKYKLGFQIRSFRIGSGAHEKSNFLSSIYTVESEVIVNSTNFEQKLHKFIIKSKVIGIPLTDEDATEYFWNVIFAKEEMTYSIILKKMNNLNPSSIMFPKLYHYYQNMEGYSCFILEDLTAQYYIPKATGDAMNLQEALCMMKCLAKFHALSLVIEAKERKPLPEVYEFCGTETFFSSAVESVMKNFIQNSYFGVIQSIQILRPDLAQLMIKLNTEKEVWNRLCDFVLPQTTTFSCLCHGDARTSNMFIKKDNNSKFENQNSINPSTGSEMKVIDFQLIRYASPITDLQYAIMLSTTTNFRRNHLNNLLKTYHTEFKSILTEVVTTQDTFINPKVKTWDFKTLVKEFKIFEIFGGLISIILLPIVYCSGESESLQMNQMEYFERSKFMNYDRKKYIFETLQNNPELAKRILDTVIETIFSN